MIHVLDIIKTFYSPKSQVYDLLLRHSEQVAQKALFVAQKLTNLETDSEFIFQAAMLHDIGIGLTRTPALGCSGSHPYVSHGILGRRLLEQNGLFKHALVCERHLGVGLKAEEIERRNLPLPVRDMMPLSLEEKIICYADKFYSKKSDKEKTIPQIIQELRRYGMDKAIRFKALHAMLSFDSLKGK